MNKMWNMKNSKDLLKYLSFSSTSGIHFIKTFNFSTLITYRRYNVLVTSKIPLVLTKKT